MSYFAVLLNLGWQDVSNGYSQSLWMFDWLWQAECHLPCVASNFSVCHCVH